MIMFNEQVQVEIKNKDCRKKIMKQGSRAETDIYLYYPDIRIIIYYPDSNLMLSG